MKLSKLIENFSEFNGQKSTIGINLEINDVCYDSRKITLGSVFVAIKGLNLDGHDFIEEAIDRGAVAVIVQDNVKTVAGIQYVKVNDTRKWLAEAACIINGYPSKYMTMIGITGTNGKTTTSYIVQQIVKKAGYSPGIIGTISNKYRPLGNNYPSTTPESLELQYIMYKMLKSKTHVILEVSSHALDLKRVHGCYFDIAVFTNLTRDHFDYHENLETYWSVKQKLFTEHLKKNGTSVINIDDHKGKILAKSLLKNSNNVITTGHTKECNIWGSSLKYSSEGTQGKIKTPIGTFNFNSTLIGKFNFSNILSAVGVGVALGATLNDISRGVNTKITIPGRLELINNSKGIFVYVDYAHTPDALEKVIKTLKSLRRGRIITIFGCGGNKDISKRAVMGKISGRFSDLSIITSDNPRSEKLEIIIGQITEGIKQTRAKYIDPLALLNSKQTSRKYTIVFDRKKAIFTGIKAANYGDTVVITGKGHETYQVVGQKVFKFDDRNEVKRQLIRL